MKQNSHHSRKALAFIIVAAAAAGSIPPFAKIGLEVFGPFTLVMIRFFFAALILLPFILKSAGLNLQSLRRYWLIGLIGALNPILVFIGLKYTKAAVTPLLYAAIPSMTALYLMGKGQRLRRGQLFGITVGFIGVAIIALLPLMGTGVLRAQELTGNLIIILAVFAFFIYSLMSKNMQNKFGASPVMLTFYFALASLVFSLPFAAMEMLSSSHSTPIGPQHILAGAEVGIVGTSLGYLAYQHALQLSSELTASLFTYLQPVSTILLAALLLRETVTLPFIVGGLLALIGAQIASGGLPGRLKTRTVPTS